MLRSVAQPQGLSLQDDLPAELRAKVYANMSPPFKGHIGEYQGILRANRFLKSEVEGEWTRNMCRFLEGIMNTRSETYSSPLRSDMPATVRDIKHVKIFFPKSVVRALAFKKFPSLSFRSSACTSRPLHSLSTRMRISRTMSRTNSFKPSRSTAKA